MRCRAERAQDPESEPERAVRRGDHEGDGRARPTGTHDQGAPEESACPRVLSPLNKAESGWGVCVQGYGCAGVGYVSYGLIAYAVEVSPFLLLERHSVETKRELEYSKADSGIDFLTTWWRCHGSGGGQRIPFGHERPVVARHAPHPQVR